MDYKLHLRVTGHPLHDGTPPGGVNSNGEVAGESTVIFEQEIDLSQWVAERLADERTPDPVLEPTLEEPTVKTTPVTATVVNNDDPGWRST